MFRLFLPVNSLKVVLISLLISLSFTCAQSQQFTDDDWTSVGDFLGVLGEVKAMAVDDNGDLYIGGNFRAVAGVDALNLAKWDGTQWSEVGGGVYGANETRVLALTIHDGDLYVGGDISGAGGEYLIDGSPFHGIIRWDGTDWHNLNTGVNGIVRALYHSGTRLYVGGDFESAGSELSADNFAAWNGSNWETLVLGASGGNGVFDITEWNNEIYAVGEFNFIGGISAAGIAKWDGTSWTPLGAGLSGPYSQNPSSIVATAGKLYVCGGFQSAGGTPTPSRCASWDGTSWEAIDLGPGVFATDLTVANGDPVAACYRDESLGLGNYRALRFDGSTWHRLTDGDDLTSSKVIAIGDTIYSGGLGVLSKWDGEKWAQFGNGLGFYDLRTDGFSKTRVNAIAISENNVFIGGFFVIANGQTCWNIARWDGSTWHPLGQGLNGTVHALAVHGDEVFAGGQFTEAGGLDSNFIARWDGHQWHPLGSGTDNIVRALAIDESGHLFAGGNFSTAGGVAANKIAKWDGNSWSALGAGVNSTVISIAIPPPEFPGNGAQLYIGGSFTRADGAEAPCLASWDGSHWTHVGGGLGHFDELPSVRALSFFGNRLFVGGNFEYAGSIPDIVRSNDIIAWNGTFWNVLPPVFNESSWVGVQSLVSSEYELFAGGEFSNPLGDGSSGLVRWDGSSWSSLGSGLSDSPVIGTTEYDAVNATALQGNRLFVGGEFSLAGEKTIPWIAQANVPDPLPEVTLESPENDLISSGGSYDFGNVSVAPGFTKKTFTIRNTGIAPLEISAVALNGIDAADFSLNTSTLATSIPPSGSTTFDLTLSPAALGLRTASLSIQGNLQGGDHFEISLTGTGAYPNIVIESPTGLELVNGESEVNLGSAVPNSTLSRTFTIRNDGDSPISRLAFSLPGWENTIFGIDPTNALPPVAPGEWITFQVLFRPDQIGNFSSTLRVWSDDADNSPFAIAISGSGAPSEISVESPVGSNLSDGDQLDLNTTLVGSSTTPRTVVIRNEGPSVLSLGVPRIGGMAAAEFSIDTTGMESELEAGSSTSFTLSFQPTIAGTRVATLRIDNNDADENPFDLALSGTGITPEITVSRVGGGNLEDGVGSADFGNVTPTGMQTLVFRITNDGTAPLNLNPSLARTGSSWFVADTAGMATSLAPGEDTTFSITFSPPDSALLGPRNASFRLINDDLDEPDFDIAVSGVVIKPEIEVAGPDSNLIVDAEGFDLGRVQTGETGLARTFTITNAGTYRLNLSGVTVGGTHSAEFVAGASSMATVLEPTESTTFTVTFSPTVKGTRTASLQIGNDDFQQSPFDITLTGFGNEPEIEVEDPQGTVLVDDVGQVDLDPVGVGSQGDWKTFRIRNTGATTLNVGEIRFTGTHAGQFSRNLAGFDTTITPNGSSTFTVRFSPTSEGLRQAVLEIESDDFDEPTFRVHLAGTGQNNQAPEIILLGDDPLVFEAAESYSDPGATATDDEDGSLTPTISANNVDPDRVGTYSVTWSVTDSLNASDSATRSVQVVDTTPPEIVPPDDIEIEATDADGAEVIYPNATVSDIVAVRSVTYSDASGSRFQIGETVVTVTATDLAGNVSNAEFLVTVLPGSLDRQGPRVRILSPNARTRTVPATFDISGDAFDNFGIDSLVVTINGENLPLDGEPPVARNERELWSVSGVEAENGPNRIEVVATDFAGRIGRAVRTVNYFQERPELAGYYAGVLAPSQEPSLDTTGLIVIQVRDNGLFTGRVFLGGFVRPIRGVLGNEGNARFFPQLGNSFEIRVGGGANARSLGFVSFSVDDLLGFSGSLMESDEELASELASFAGRKAPHTFRNQVSEELLNQPVNRTPTRGYHTISFPNKDQDPARDPSSFPQGDGAGILILSRTGSARLTGFLADGTRFVSSGKLREDETLPVFARIHARKGNLSGELSFEDLPDSDVSGLGFLWLRPELPRSPRYPDGWPGGIRVDALGTLFAFPGSVDFTQGAADPENGNAAFQFSDGGLGDLVAHVVSIDPDTGRLIRVPVPNRDIFPRLNRQSGWLTGRFRLEDGRLAPFRGVLLNKGANRGGFGYFITPGRDSEGGGMSLIPQSALE